MTSMWTLLPPGSRPRALGVAILAIVVPLLVMLALVPRPTQEQVPVAIVNLDVPVEDGQTPVAAGKLLTENLLTTSGGIAWTLTDTGTASTGLERGTYAAVVTIPATFSADVATLGTTAAQAAQLDVTTTTRHGYLSGVLAQALAAGLPREVEAQLTSGFVSGTLAAFDELNTGIGEAAAGAQQLASGISAAADGAGEIASGAGELQTGLAGIGTVLRALPDGARDLGRASAAAAADAAALTASLAGGAAEVEALVIAQDLGVADIDLIVAAIAADPAAPVSTLLDDIQALRAGAAAVAADLQTHADGLAVDAVDAAELAIGAGVVADVAGPVADALTAVSAAETGASAGAGALADAAGELAGGLSSAAAAGGELASGLDEAAAGIPAYTAAQQKAIATVVASPIQVTTSTVGGPDTALAAAVGLLAPVSLWLGALAMFLIVAPFARSALTTSATATRITADATIVALVVAAVQAALVWLGIAVLGVTPDRIGVALGLTLSAAIAFALFHQALTAVFGRAGLIVSVLALGLQLVAAGTLGPVDSGSLSTTPLALLPLSLALQGADALVGGSLHEVLQAAIGLLVWAVVGFVAAVWGVHRARTRSIRAVLTTPA